MKSQKGKVEYREMGRALMKIGRKIATNARIIN
jgi:hypothetical protein